MISSEALMQSKTMKSIDFFTDSGPEVIRQAKLEVTFSFSLVLK